jgi:hypothetical protein
MASITLAVSAGFVSSHLRGILDAEAGLSPGAIHEVFAG